MKKIKKYIKKSQFVKVFITDKEEQALTHFEGIIFEQNEDFIVMCDLSDFNYDGFVVLRKEDISDTKRSENEKFFNRILKEEKISKEIRRRNKDIDFQLDDMQNMFRQLKEMGIAVIVECLYGSEESFQIGPIVKVKKEKMKMDYFNSRGEYTEAPISAFFSDITFFRFDSPYANLFFKYAEFPQSPKQVANKVKKKKTAKIKDKTKYSVKKDKTNQVEKVPEDKKSKKSEKVKSKKSTDEQNPEKEKKSSTKGKKAKKYKRPKQTERLMLVV